MEQTTRTMSFYPSLCSHDISCRPVNAISAYRFFFHDRRGPVQTEHLRVTGEPMPFAILSERMMNMWDTLDATSKAYYEELHAKDQRRYTMECIAWEARIEQQAKEQARTEAATSSTAEAT